MGQFKHEGNPALALAEECAEVIQIITKKFRFDNEWDGDWDVIPFGKDKSRWEMLEEEMGDLLFQWERLKMVKDVKVIGKINLDSGPSDEDMQADAEYMHSMELDEEWPDDSEQDSDWPEFEPKYVVVSTSYKVNETAIFQSNEKGDITNFNAYTAMSEYWCKGDMKDRWQDHNYLMSHWDKEGKYDKVKNEYYPEDAYGPQSLWVRS